MKPIVMEQAELQPLYDSYHRKIAKIDLHNVGYPKQGDFLVDDKHIFEVGGKGKTFDQIADVPDSYLAVDDTEVGSGSRIPFWLFGFLY